MSLRDGEKGLQNQQKQKIDDSEGMCGSELAYDTCWSRICNPDRSHVVKDLLRGLLVLIVLAIVVTVVFLLCYFLIQDIKEEKKIDELIDIFSDEIEEGGKSSFRKEVAIKTTTTTTEPDGHDMFSKSPPVFIDTLAPHVPESSSHGSLLLAEVLPTKLPKTDEDTFLTGVDYDSNFYDIESVNAREIFITEDVNVCDSLRLPICSSMPWAVTTLPNWVNNNNVNELYDSVKYFENTIIKSQCSDRVLEYTCAILEPACGPDGIALPPCKTFCEDVARSCGEFLINGNKHNSAFQCDRYPDSTNPNTCNTVKSASPKIFNKPSLTSEPSSDNIPSLKPTLPIEQPDPIIIEVPAPVTTEITTTIAEIIPDEETTTVLPVFICDETMFLCNDGSDCLQQESICDGVQHCLDNTDEENCTKPEITSTFIPVAPLTKSSDLVIRNSPQRTSLSDMLSSTSLVAGPGLIITQPPVTIRGQKLRFTSTAISRDTKSLDIAPSPSNRNSFLFTSKPENQKTNQEETSSKLSLASLLSTSITPSSPRSIGSHSESHPSFFEGEKPTPTRDTSPRRQTLSELLSTAALQTSPSIRVTVTECPELKCIDGKCITLKQLNDGFEDCSDGSDEFPVQRS